MSWWVVIVVVIIILLILFFRIEGFATKQDKASAIVDWFTTIGSAAPTYNNYRQSINRANIVEYEDMRDLYKQGNLNQNTAVSAL